MAEPSGPVEGPADTPLADDPALQKASLALLLRERLVATVDGRSGEVVTANDRFAELLHLPPRA